MDPKRERPTITKHAQALSNPIIGSSRNLLQHYFFPQHCRTLQYWRFPKLLHISKCTIVRASLLQEVYNRTVKPMLHSPTDTGHGGAEDLSRFQTLFKTSHPGSLHSIQAPWVHGSISWVHGPGYNGPP